MVFFISEVNNKVDVFLKQKGIPTRDGGSAGVFVPLLLPLSILKGEFRFYFYQLNVKLWIPISFGLLLHSVLNIFYVKRNIPIYNGLALIPSILLTFFLTYTSFNDGTTWKVLLNCSLIFFYEYGVFNIMRICPKAFTYGESCIVSQGLVLFVASCFSVYDSSTSSICIINATIILKVGILCLMGMSFSCFTFVLGERPVMFFCVIASSICFILLPVLHYLIGASPILWIYELVTCDLYTTVLFGYWILCTLIGVTIVSYQIHLKKKANTMVRKSFHALILIVFCPGIMINPCLMYLASGIVFALFIMIDVMRLLKVPFVSSALENGFKMFSDEKDSGGMSLTPLYLVVGCSFPLWIHPDLSSNNLLPLLSGLLTVAVGDSAASLCGSMFGRNKWPGTNKTKEGTIACFLSQLFCVITLIHFGYLPRKDLIRPVSAISAASIVEARTTQIDNLILPMLMYIIVV